MSGSGSFFNGESKLPICVADVNHQNKCCDSSFINFAAFCNGMIRKLEEIKLRFEEVGQILSQPAVVSDMKKFTQLSKEYRDLEKVVRKYDAYSAVLDALQHAREVLENEKDAELRELAKMELEELAPKRDQLDSEIKDLLMPKEPNDYKNCILEIRAGTGGDEAAIFAGDLWRMYQRLCERKGFNMTEVDVTEGTAGG